MDFEVTPRRSVVVYLKNVRQARQLRRFGVVSYMNEEDVASKSALIERLGFVASVDVSHWPEVDTTIGSQGEAFEFSVDPSELVDEPAEEEEL